MKLDWWVKQSETRLMELRIKRRKGSVETLDTGSERLTRKDLQLIYNDLVTTKFTVNEVAKIRHNWARFQKNYGFDDPIPFINFKEGGAKAFLGAKNMYRFKLFLSHGLPNRGLYYIYQKWVRLMCCQKKGKFSYAEQCLISELLPLCDSDSRVMTVTIIMLALQRPRKAILTKIKERCALPMPDVIPANKQSWTAEKDELLVKALCEELGADSLEKLKESVSLRVWRDVAKRLQVTRKQAYDRWHLHLVPALMATCDLTRPELELRLITWLKKKVDQGKISDWGHVDWRTVAEKVGGFGHLYVYRVVMTMRWNNVLMKSERDNIKDSVKILYELALPNIRDRSPTRNKTSETLRSPIRDGYLLRAKYDFTSHTLSYL